MNIFAKMMEYFPAVLAGIIGVEKAVNVPGQTKKALIMGAVAAAAKAGEDIPSPTVQGISALIDNTVTVLNEAGVFSTTTKPPAA